EARIRSTGRHSSDNFRLLGWIAELIFEAYALLQREGIHVQLDLDVDKDGRYRLRATSAELVDELKAKLRELKGQPARQP
ncbi:MAG: hypothetical protein ABI614_24365, partial [Planctomycetota bacterium]